MTKLCKPHWPARCFVNTNIVLVKRIMAKYVKTFKLRRTCWYHNIHVAMA